MDLYKLHDQKISIPVYYMNLNEDVEKNDDMIAQLKELNADYYRISSVNGKVLSSIDIQESNDDVIEIEDFKIIIHNKKMCGSQIGCFLSHYKTYLQMIKNNHNIALILEDDIIFETKYWINHFDDIYNNAPEFNILKLQSSSPVVIQYLNEISHTTKYIDNRELIRMFGDSENISGAGYIITLEGIKQILKKFVNNHVNNDDDVITIYNPIDLFMYDIEKVYNYTYPLFTFNRKTMFHNWFEVYTTEHVLDFYGDNLTSIELIDFSKDIVGTYVREIEFRHRNFMIYKKINSTVNVHIERFQNSWYIYYKNKYIFNLGDDIVKLCDNGKLSKKVYQTK
jgi:GR25 family glycosyltransferase involved in LPS biosynthesis